MPKMHEYLSTAPVTSWVSGDGILLCRDPSGTPLTKWITLDNLFQTIATDVKLPATTATVGSVYSGGKLFCHRFTHPTGRGQVGDEVPTGRNTFLGEDAGNLTMGAQATHQWQASYQTAVGWHALKSVTTAGCNTAIGCSSMEDTVDGDDNTAVGIYTLSTNTSGQRNVAIGYGVCQYTTNAGYNVGLGYYALAESTTGQLNVALGAFAGGKNTDVSNQLFVNNVMQATYADDKRYSLLYGIFSGGAASLENQELTVNGNFTVAGLGSATTAGVVCSVGTGNNNCTAGNAYSLKIEKYGSAPYVSAFFGVNKNSASGQIPDSATFIGPQVSNGAFVVARNIGDFLNSVVDIYCDGSGNVGIGTTGTLNSLLQVGGGAGTATPRQCLTFGLAGFSEPATCGTAANGDKLVLWSITGLSDTRFGMSDTVGLWLKSMGAAGSPNAFNLYSTTATSGNPPLTWAITKNGYSCNNGVRLHQKAELTIASGVVAATRSFHTIDTESDGASDDLDTINGGTDGDILVIRAVHTDRTVVAKDGTGNLYLEGDCTLDSSSDTLTLIYDGDLAKWVELARSNNA